MTTLNGRAVRAALALSAWCALTAPLVACRSASGRAPEPAVRSDATLFEASIRAVVAQIGGPVFVDPRPVRADESVSTLGEELFTSATEVELRVRRASVHALGLTAADVATLSRCDGVSKIYDRVVAHQGCPERPEAYALLASTTAAEQSAGDSTSVVALVLTRSARGIALTTYQVIAARQGQGWRILRVTPTLVRE